jgi:DNA-binding transcriptional ArsR family regulator
MVSFGFGSDAMSGDECDDRADDKRDPAAAFSALADERRIAVLRALYDAESEATDSEELRLSFSELYDRVDIDGSSTFSYHLDELRGIYVTDGHGGYALTATGRRVVQAILGGVYTELPSFDSHALEATCPACEHSPVEVVCEDGVLAVVCPECSVPFLRDQVQPSQLLGRTPEEAVESYDRKLRHDMALDLDGICSGCGGTMTVSVRPSSHQLELDWIAVLECSQCDAQNRIPPYFALLFHPVVHSFYWERGVDIREVPTWRVVEFVVTGEWSPTVTDTDPFECRIDIERDGDRLSVTLDESLRVTDATARMAESKFPNDDTIE